MRVSFAWSLARDTGFMTIHRMSGPVGLSRGCAFIYSSVLTKPFEVYLKPLFLAEGVPMLSNPQIK